MSKPTIFSSKAVIYARVSSREQEKEGYSIPAQLKLLREYAQKNNLEVVQEYTDSETAKKTGRTSYTDMLKYLKKNKNIRTVLVEKTDRLYRNFKDYVQLEDYNLEVHLVKEGAVLSENSNSNQKFMHGIKVLMAKNYIDNLSEEVKKGQRQKAEQGEYPSKQPFGYQRLNTKTIVPEENSAKFVQRAFELFAEGNISLDKLRFKLHEEGFIYKQETPVMVKSMINKILKNPFYIGEFEYSGRKYKGVHEPIVSRELFYKAQMAFKKDNKPLYRNDHNFVFAGLLRCAECGCSIVAELKKGKYIYYHCTGGKGECSQKSQYIREEQIEEQLVEAIKKIQVNQEQKEWIIESLKKSNEMKNDFAEDRIEALQLQCKKLRERINKIYIDKLDGIITEDFWLEKHNDWNNQLFKLQDIIKSFEVANKNYIEAALSILDVAETASEVYLSETPAVKTRLLNSLLSNFLLKDGNVSYTYKKPFDILAKGLSCSKNLGREDSNLRMPIPKTGALPLGDAPPVIYTYILLRP